MDLLDLDVNIDPASLDFFLPQEFAGSSAELSDEPSSSRESSFSRDEGSAEYTPVAVAGEDSSDVSPPTFVKRERSESAASRKRKTPANKADVTSDCVTLSRDVLLTISSAEFDELVASITGRRRLSDHEQKEVRRQKRLIKNRESAALSRNRKKQALETLEEENSKLRDELGTLKQFLQQTNQMAVYLSSLAAPMGSKRSGAGIMFVFLLSFGLFLNLPLFSGKTPLSAGGPGPNLRTLMNFDPNARHVSALTLPASSSSSSSSCSSSLLLRDLDLQNNNRLVCNSTEPIGISA